MELAKVEEDGIVIRLPWPALEMATEWCPGLEVEDKQTASVHQPRVVDVRVWAAEVVRELNREAEHGETAVTRLFDTAFVTASEQGAEGVRCWGDED
jgi:hypothetical protein